MSERPVRVEIAPPFASTPGEPTLDMSFPTTPRHRSGAGISQQTARDLIRELQTVLDEINGPPEEIVTINGNQYKVGEWDLREPGEEPDDDWTWTLYATRVSTDSSTEKG